MISPGTVFVIGAAASQDFGFPLGATFKSDIAKLLSWEEDSLGHPKLQSETNKFLQAFPSNKQEILKAARQIALGLPFSASIDNFLEMRQSDPGIAECGKAAIAYLLMKKEQACGRLKVRTKYDYKLQSTDFDKSWMQIFAEICFQGCKQVDLPEALSRFSVISFNYDRCF